MNSSPNAVTPSRLYREFSPKVEGLPRPVTDRLTYHLRYGNLSLPPDDPRWGLIDSYLSSKAVATARSIVKSTKEIWQRRIEASWVGPGLSNAPYLDATTRTEFLGLRARLLINPGTLKLRIGGLLQSRIGGESVRGIIQKLSKKSRSRLLELARELEAAGIYPEMMITLTYPREWEKSISIEHDEALWQFRRAWGRMNAHRYRSKGPDWAERWAELRAEVRARLLRLREVGPDGKKVKAHLEAFRKRFERRFGTAWGLIWKLEFQRRGAPHIHLFLWDCQGINPAELRAWIGRAWAEVVAGSDLSAYFDPQSLALYDAYREQGGREFAEAMLEGMGLSTGTWNHIRAGTGVEILREKHWGYLAKEIQGGMNKAYQHVVPRRYRNVGRWWGYWRYKRAGWIELFYDLASASMHDIKEAIIKPVEAALKTLPKACKDFRERAKAMLTRFIKTGSLTAQRIDSNGVITEGAYGYLTVWGRAAVQAAMEFLLSPAG